MDETLYVGAPRTTWRADCRVQAARRPVASAVRLGCGSRALDVGCGPGSLTLLLAPHVDQIVGVDAEQEMITQAQLAASSRDQQRQLEATPKRATAG
jgi:2-polyprenyl-3-methyl-5-hydroxy-6-metoxy-1,4-benzoquinol methylase